MICSPLLRKAPACCFREVTDVLPLPPRQFFGCGVKYSLDDRTPRTPLLPEETFRPILPTFFTFVSLADLPSLQREGKASLPTQGD